ncbi:MAG: ornithine cyclodeaminase family protein [Flavobacteriaceae bacterium]
MEWINDDFIRRHVSYPELMGALKSGFAENTVQCPPKLVYTYTNHRDLEKNTALVMPAWDNTDFFGLKMVTATPGNKHGDTPYLNGTYQLFNANTGIPILAMDAKLLTNMRTAATSTLASKLLAGSHASSVLILGNGALAPFYVEAYGALPSVKNIYVWGRNFEMSQHLAKDTTIGAQLEAVQNYREYTEGVDIIVSITSSKEPLIYPHYLGVGQHYDLVGSYTTDMAEFSGEVLANCSVFVDNRDVTPDHSGEFAQALEQGFIRRDHIKGDMAQLCKNGYVRTSREECTLFKSTGMALEDLVMARLIFKKYTDARQ